MTNGQVPGVLRAFPIRCERTGCGCEIYGPVKFCPYCGKRFVPAKGIDSKNELGLSYGSEIYATKERKVTESSRIYDEFFSRFLEIINRKTRLFSKSQIYGRQYVIAKPFKGRDVQFGSQITRHDASVFVYINLGDRGENKKLFDFLKSRDMKIEAVFGGKRLKWDRKENKSL